ncbi:NADAR domain-containing protein [Staphylococcus aureus]|uniref:NADAR domain-containing protein n=1 Tax=Staphylococcus aureus TaxID=1280 RepID=UPI001CF353D4|nr:NADAR family protein [Staphylococcus aureus]
METGDQIIVECAVKDRVWGIGLSMHDPNRFDMRRWKGENRLGFALMEIREEMKT